MASVVFISIPYSISNCFPTCHKYTHCLSLTHFSYLDDLKGNFMEF